MIIQTSLHSIAHIRSTEKVPIAQPDSFTYNDPMNMSDPNAPRTGENAEAPKEKPDDFWDLIKFTLIALVIVIPLRLFIAQPFVVSGESMYPTFDNGDYLIVDEISYRLGDIKRGDVVIFRYPRDPQRFFIKRVIGLPGETVQFDNETITITGVEHPEGLVWNEPYIVEHSTGRFGVTLAEDEYFVMGDNRNASSDSRVWGPLDKEYIIGRAAVRLLPVKEIGILPGDYKQLESE